MNRPPHALVECAVQTTSDEAAERLRVALPALVSGHEGASARIDPACGRVLVGAADEAALEALTIGMIAALRADIELLQPEVVYRETIRRPAEIDETYRHAIGSRGEFARVRILFEPLPRGSGFVIAPPRCGSAVPPAFLPGVERGLAAARDDGLLAGYAVTDLRATLLDGDFQEADSTVRSFAIAARRAFRRLLDEGEPAMLEPISRLDLIVPADCAQAVIDDLMQRRARDLEHGPRGAEVALTALVPLTCLFGYRHILRGLSQGRARRRQGFSHYAEVEPEMCAPAAFAPAAPMAMRA
jgi:elongation factor G